MKVNVAWVKTRLGGVMSRAGQPPVRFREGRAGQIKFKDHLDFHIYADECLHSPYIWLYRYTDICVLLKRPIL